MRKYVSKKMVGDVELTTELILPDVLPDDRQVFNVDQLIEYLKPTHPKISRSTIDKWVGKTRSKIMKFPFHKKGRPLYFYKDEIDNWLKSKS